MNTTVPVEIFWRMLSPAKRKDLLIQSGAPYVEWQRKALAREEWSSLGPVAQEAILDTLKQAADNIARHRT